MGTGKDIFSAFIKGIKNPLRIERFFDMPVTSHVTPIRDFRPTGILPF